MALSSHHKPTLGWELGHFKTAPFCVQEHSCAALAVTERLIKLPDPTV
jgi:hypothetical protein